MAKNVSGGSRVTPYGLKEVADLYFFPTNTSVEVTMDSEGNFTIAGSTSVTTESNGETVTTTATVAPQFVFETLKVSNIEISAEEATATGGKGNAELISWSYGKEITLTIEDAVFNLSTIDLLFGSKEGTHDKTGSQTITITPDSFPGYYKMIGVTYIRNQSSGKDEGFVFTIGKGKVNLGGTLTMEADGDPSTFEMTIKALKDDEGNLIKFERLASSTSQASVLDSNTAEYSNT